MQLTSTCRLWCSLLGNWSSLISCCLKWRLEATRCSSSPRWCAAWISWKTTSFREGISGRWGILNPEKKTVIMIWLIHWGHLAFQIIFFKELPSSVHKLLFKNRHGFIGCAWKAFNNQLFWLKKSTRFTLVIFLLDSCLRLCLLFPPSNYTELRQGSAAGYGCLEASTIFHK